MREQAKFWHDSELHDLELLHANFITHRYPPHTHEGFAIGIIEEGVEVFQYHGSQHCAPAGTIVLINPHEVHTGSAYLDSGWRYRMFYPSTDHLQSVASQMAGKPRGIPYFREAVLYDHSLAEEMAQVHRALVSGTDRLERESRILMMFTHLIEQHADDRPQIHVPQYLEKTAIQHIQAIINNRYAEHLSLDELADLVGFSPYYLLRIFHKTVGLPPHAYLTQVRINRAREFLKRGIPPIDTAALVGFADQSHLNRHFKRIVGVSPGHYRQSMTS